MSARDEIEHFVVLMMENRSFDHMLGTLSLEGLANLDGVRAGMQNPSGAGTPVSIEGRAPRTLEPDPEHRYDHVKDQLAGPTAGDRNLGFFLDFEKTCTREGKGTPASVLWYFTRSSNTADVLHTLALEYAVCDRWFASVPSETWPNRLFMHTASSDGKLMNQTRIYSMPTIFDRLEKAGLSWAVYCDQFPQSAALSRLADNFVFGPLDPNRRFRSIKRFYKDCRNGMLPNYAFLEPSYFNKTANDDHPPHDVVRGQQLMADIYHEVRRSSLWKKSLLAILYDEHGGFFDHVEPPAAVPPRPGEIGDFGFDFTSLGPRVPFVLVSPWVPKGFVFGTPQHDGRSYDHTSLVATVLRKWGLPPLTDRDRNARDLWDVLSLASPRADDTSTRDHLAGWRPARVGLPDQPEAAGVATGLAAAATPVAKPKKRTPAAPSFERKSGLEVARYYAAMGRASGGVSAAAAGTVSPSATERLSDFQQSLSDLAALVAERHSGATVLPP